MNVLTAIPAPSASAASDRRVWIGCLGCYNAGHLAGEWFDSGSIPCDELTWRKGVDLKAGTGSFAAAGEHIADGHEELWAFDSDGFPAFCSSGEASPAEYARWDDWLTEAEDRLRPLGIEALCAWVDSGSCTLDGDGFPDLPSFEDAYCGEFDSERDYAEQAFADGAAEHEETLSRWPFSCIDWERATAELFFDYHSAPASQGGVFVFRCF